MRTQLKYDSEKESGKYESEPTSGHELIASEDRYRLLFETANDGILILNAETGMIVDVNPFLIDLLGYTKEEFIEKEMWEIGFIKDIIDSKDKFLELKQKGYLRYEDLPFKTAHGQKIDVEFISNLFTENNQKLVQCNIRDITKRKHQESGLEKTRKGLAVIKKTADELSEFAENIIDTIREPLLLLNNELKVVKASRSFYEFFKVLPEETIGKLIYELGNHQWNIPGLRVLLETVLPEKTTFENYEVEHVFSGIGKRIMLLNARQIERAFGMEKIILLAIEDITERKQAEESFSEENRLTNEYLDILFNHANVPIIIWDAESVITRHNRAFEELIGYDLSNAEDKKIDVLFPKDKLDLSLKLIKNSLRNEKPELVEVEIVTRNNGLKTVLWNSTNIFDKEGKKIVATVAQDITTRKRTEDAISNLETRYRRLFESAKDGILILDAQTGCIIDVNPFLIELLGYSKEDLLEKEIWEIGFFKDIAANAEKFLELQQKGYVRYDNLPLETVDGRKINVEFVSNVYLVNRKNVIQCNIRDITKRKKAEKALIISESHLHTLVQAIPDLIWTKDVDGIYLSCNTMFGRFFGASEAEIIGKTDYDFVEKELADFFRENDRKAMEAGEPTTNEEWVTFADDKRAVCLETIKAPMFDAHNKLIGVLGIGRDITLRKNSEKALRHSEKKFRNYIDNAPDGIFIIDETGKFTDANHAACAMSGFSKNELLKMSIPDILAETSLAEGLSQFNKLILEGTSKAELLIKHSTEVKKWWSFDAVKLSKSRFLLFAKDITERKLSEEEILMLSHSLKSVNECVSITDMENKILFVNESFLRTYGYEINELIGKNISLIGSQYNHQKQVDEILPATIFGSWKGELLNRRKDGSEFPVYLSTSVVRDRDSKVLGLIGVATDITERKKAEDELKEKNTFIQKVMDNLPVGISLNSIRSGSALYVNNKFEEIYGWPVEEMKDITGFFEKVYPDKEYREELTARIVEDINSGDSTRMHWEDCKVKHKDGSEHVVNAVNIPLFEQDIMVSTVIDITERKRGELELIKAKEKAEESDRLKSAFLTNMSHEIRTPMNGILGFAGLLKEPMLTGEEQKSYIAIIEKSGARMLNIINDIVSISKIESGQMIVSVSDTNVNEQVEDVYMLFKQEAEQKNIRFFYTNPLPTKEAIVRADKEKLFAILSNLVKNAIKFTDKGSIKIGYKKKDEFLEFFVKDTGIGVSKAQKEFIFERFRQGSESRTRNYEGAGLGLSISKAYIEMLGGKIRVESNSDGPGSEKGSAFFFTIPYIPAREEKIPATTEVDDNTTDTKIRNLKILIADDDETSKMLISIIAKTISNNVIEVSNGSDAIEACRNNPDIDLVLMDIKMPGMDGYEATRQIRKFNTHVIIIAQTAFALDGDRAKSIEAGCNDNITKPIDPILLIAMIKNIFIK